jgi:hypothetical protein
MQAGKLHGKYSIQKQEVSKVRKVQTTASTIVDSSDLDASIQELLYHHGRSPLLPFGRQLAELHSERAINLDTGYINISFSARPSLFLLGGNPAEKTGIVKIRGTHYVVVYSLCVQVFIHYRTKAASNLLLYRRNTSHWI